MGCCFFDVKTSSKILVILSTQFRNERRFAGDKVHATHVKIRKRLHSPNEMWLRGVEGGHEVVELLLVEGGNGFAAALLLLSAARTLVVLPRLTRMVTENVIDQSVIAKVNSKVITTITYLI